MPHSAQSIPCQSSDWQTEDLLAFYYAHPCDLFEKSLRAACLYLDRIVVLFPGKLANRIHSVFHNFEYVHSNIDREKHLRDQLAFLFERGVLVDAVDFLFPENELREFADKLFGAISGRPSDVIPMRGRDDKFPMLVSLDYAVDERFRPVIGALDNLHLMRPGIFDSDVGKVYKAFTFLAESSALYAHLWRYKKEFSLAALDGHLLEWFLIFKSTLPQRLGLIPFNNRQRPFQTMAENLHTIQRSMPSPSGVEDSKRVSLATTLSVRSISRSLPAFDLQSYEDLLDLRKELRRHRRGLEFVTGQIVSEHISSSLRCGIDSSVEALESALEEALRDLDAQIRASDRQVRNAVAKDAVVSTGLSLLAIGWGKHTAEVGSSLLTRLLLKTLVEVYTTREKKAKLIEDSGLSFLLRLRRL
jgi:hypothetical protein